MTIVGTDMAPAFRAKQRNRPVSLSAALWQRLAKIDARMAAVALGFIETKPRGAPAKRDPFPPLDPARLAVAFKQGFTGGGTAETVPAAGREKKFGSHVTVQAHQIEALYKPISGRSVVDVLDDYEAQQAIARNFRMTWLDLRQWRKKRGSR
ncbi:MAG: hypothetical protein KF895_03225 [Parvibaculum sp.]|nr:hypothetical protein [Parvibaculum sp.]